MHFSSDISEIVVIFHVFIIEYDVICCMLSDFVCYDVTLEYVFLIIYMHSDEP